jgi:hypothetical protein
VTPLDYAVCNTPRSDSIIVTTVTYLEATMGRRGEGLASKEEMYLWLKKKPATGVTGEELRHMWGYDGASGTTRKRNSDFNRWLAKTHKEKLELRYTLRSLTASEKRDLD